MGWGGPLAGGPGWRFAPSALVPRPIPLAPPGWAGLGWLGRILTANCPLRLPSPPNRTRTRTRTNTVALASLVLAHSPSLPWRPSSVPAADHRPSHPQARSFLSLSGFDMARAAAASVFERSGLRPHDVDVLECHDCFSCAELFMCVRACSCVCHYACH